MNGQDDYILCVAGEDSGDVIGKKIVEEIVKNNFQAVGTGGSLMQKAGLKSIANFEDMAVNGFFDVFKNCPNFFPSKENCKKCSSIKIAKL